MSAFRASRASSDPSSAALIQRAGTPEAASRARISSWRRAIAAWRGFWFLICSSTLWKGGAASPAGSLREPPDGAGRVISSVMARTSASKKGSAPAPALGRRL